MTKLDWPRGGKHIFVGGNWTRVGDDAESIPAISPIDERVVGHVAAATSDDVDRAVQSIQPSLEGWAMLSTSERASYLMRFGEAIVEHADELAELDVLDGGLTARTAINDLKTASASPAFFSSYANLVHGATFSSPNGTFGYTVREPYGIAARITPFNHPLMFAVQTSSPVLLAGNAVIVKPAEVSSLSSLALAEIARLIFPAGVFNVITGYGHEAGNAIVSHPGIPRIGFTGSVPTGRRILADAATHVKHVTLELGGKNPLIIDKDVDPEFAATVAFNGMSFHLAGQSCQSTSRVLIHSSLHDDVVEALADRMGNLAVGDPRLSATDVGPVAFRAHYERILSYLAIAKEEGATVVTGGKAPDGLQAGFYVEPTLFSGVNEDMRISREEVFGPVVAVQQFDQVEDAIRIANDTEFGLTASVLAQSLDRATAIGRRIKAGTVLLNTDGKRPLGMPFGGFKESGLGKQSCLEEVLSYTEEKSVVAGLNSV